MRRLDADGDDELSFSDFFAGLLPYFIYGDLKGEMQANMMAAKFSKRKSSKYASSLHGNRNKSANIAARRKPSNMFQRNQEVRNDDFEDDFLGENIQNLRNS